MEEITIIIRIDENYRKGIEKFGVNFDDYLTGVLLNHMMRGREMSQLIEGLELNSLAAKAHLVNVAGLGRVMSEIVNTVSPHPAQL